MLLALITALSAHVYPGALEAGARASLRSEARGGELSDGVAPTAAGDLELAPKLTVAGRDEELMDFEVSYEPSLLLKSQDLHSAPRVLHELAATWKQGERRGDGLMLHLSAFSGPLDYDRAARNLAGDGTVAALPVGGLVSYANGDAMLAAVRQQTLRLRLEADLGVGYTGPSVTDQTPGVIDRQLRAFAVGGLSWLAARRTTLGADVTFSGVTFEAGASYLGVAPTVSVRQRLSHDTALSLRAGAQVTRSSGDGSGAAGGNGIQPVASAVLESTLPFSRRTALTLQAKGEVAPFYDIFKAELLTRAIGTVTAELAVKRGPALRLRGQWYEPFGAPTARPGPVYDALEQRLAAVAASVLAPLRRGLQLEAGVVALHRWAEGAPVTAFSGSPEWLGFTSLTAELDLGEVEARPPDHPHHGAAP